jgi:hypothetical protein
VTTTIDIEDLHTTKSEKLLALAMTAFLLIGGVWEYQRLDDIVRRHVPLREATGADRGAIERSASAQQRVYAAQARVGEARRELVLRRERFRTAIEAKRPAKQLEQQYLAAESAYTRANAHLRDARRAAAAARPAAAAAERRVARGMAARAQTQERYIFALRFLLVLVTLAIGYWLLARLRARNSRYLPLAGAVLAFATIMALVLAGDYVTDYVEPFEQGILLLAAIGVAATAAAFVILQRYLAQRLSRRRVRKGQCPFCGFGVGGGEHCEGCGRTVVAPCARCAAPRRVAAPFCATCGNP